jgi:hypothetical protein
MVVFDRRDTGVKEYLYTDAFAAMFSAPAGAAAADFSSVRKFMYGMTRSDWVKCQAKDLFDAAGGFDSLRFISEETCTHREFVVSDPKDLEKEGDIYGTDVQATLFDPADYDVIMQDIDRFIGWCANNVRLVEKLVEHDGEASILAGIYHTEPSDKPTDLDDEGQGSRVLLCTFKSVRAYLAHAKQHGLRAVYMNEQYTSLDWYRKNAGMNASHPGYHGKLHVNENYERPVRSQDPVPSFPPPGLPIDVGAMLADSSPEQIEQVKMIRPYWAKGDDIAFLFDHEATLLQSGRVVWGALIQANKMLFEPKYVFGAGGEVLYDPAGRMSRESLLAEAHWIFSLKGNAQYGDADRQFISDYLADELTRVFGKDAPDPAHSGYPLKISSTYFDQLQLPDGMLSLPYFPLLISDACPGAAMLLPCRFWPAEFTDEWLQACEEKFGKRHDAGQLHERAVRRAQGLQEEIDADPAPLNMHGPSLYEEGLLHFHGRGVVQDYDMARRLWEKAARMGHPESMNNLGIIYAEGRGVAVDMRLALAWYGKAAEKSFVLGQLNLGKMHLRYDGGDNDLVKAQFWLEQAAAQGNEEARQLLAEYGLANASSDAPGALGNLWKKWFNQND